MQKILLINFSVDFYYFLYPFLFGETIFLCIFAKPGVINASLLSKSHTNIMINRLNYDCKTV